MFFKLFLYGSSNRAGLSAGSAADAIICVDNVDVTLYNARCRALTCASAASDAIVCNLVCHFYYLHFYND